jgi:hypothetical protein
MWSLLCLQEGDLNVRFVQKHNHGAHLDLLLISKSRVVLRMQLENMPPRTIMQSSSDPPNVAAVHSTGGCHHTLCLNGRYFDVKVKCPIAVII